MKKLLIVKLGLIISVIAVIIIILFFRSRVDFSKLYANDICINLQYSSNRYPSIHKLIDDVCDDGERVAFYPDESKEILKTFDINYLDISGGRLLFLREKRNLLGRNRTFILHRDVSRPILIDNSSSQDSRLTWLASRGNTLNEVKK